MMKKVYLILVMMCMVLGLSACQFSTHGELYDDEDRMVATGDTYSFLGKYSDSDSISFRRFSGIYTLKRIDRDDDFTMTIDMDIDLGRFKCFLVDEDDQIIELVQGENLITSYVGKLRLRIAGDDAKGNMSFVIGS
jgi:hypothetical protein